MSMPVANASIAHLLIDATIPLPRPGPVLLHALIYIYRLAQRHSHSGLAVAGGSCRGAGALWSAARASGALLWPAAMRGRQQGYSPPREQISAL